MSTNRIVIWVIIIVVLIALAWFFAIKPYHQSVIPQRPFSTSVSAPPTNYP